MFDRSKEFTELMRRTSPFLACGVVEAGSSIGTGTGSGSDKSQDNEQQNSSYSRIRTVLESVEKIKRITGETEVLHKNALAEAKTEECVKLIGRVEGLVGAVLKEADETRKVLAALQGVQASGPEAAKIRSVSRAFLQAMQHFERVQEDYRDRYRKQLERQYRLIDPKGSQSDLDLSRLSESQTSLILSQQIFRLSEDSRARKELESMRQRNAEMHELEKGIEEVRVMFEEISVLVRQQGDLVNKVEDYVVEINGNVERAGVALDKSIEMHKKQQARKRMALIIGLVILSILILIILNELFPSLFSFF